MADQYYYFAVKGNRGDDIIAQSDGRFNCQGVVGSGRFIELNNAIETDGIWNSGEKDFRNYFPSKPSHINVNRFHEKMYLAVDEILKIIPILNQEEWDTFAKGLIEKQNSPD
jgi:hypothetical protein